jgi:spore germination protein
VQRTVKAEVKAIKKTEGSRREGRIPMNNREMITSNQLMAIMISTIIGIGILTLPRTVTDAAGPDGWLLVLAGGIVTILTSVIIAKLGLLFPERTVVEYGTDIITKPLGILFSLGFCIYYVLFCAFEARVFAEVTKQFLLDRTPTEVIVITMLLGTSYLVRHDIATIGRMGEMLVPVFVIPGFLFLLPAIPDMDLTHMLPFLKTHPSKLLPGLAAIVTSYLGFETLLLFQPFMARPRDAGKAMVTSLSAITLLYVIVVVAAVSIFGTVEVRDLIWPTFSMYRVIKIPGAFIENIHGVMMALWVVAVYITLAVFFFAAVMIIGRLLALKEHSFIALPLAFLIYFLALIPDNIPQVYDYLDMLSLYLGVPFGFFFPVLFYITAKVRGKGKEGGSGSEKQLKKGG